MAADRGSRGSPLDSSNVARYTFWPSRKAEMPLLYEGGAWCILATIPAAAMSNERKHSVAGRIVSKTRGALKPASIERLTLAYDHLPKEAEALADEFAARLGLASREALDPGEIDALLAAEMPPPLVRLPCYPFCEAA